MREFQGIDGTGANGDSREIAIALTLFLLFPSVQK
jgi:hypothetical protein